jgi:hypothetical protein
MWPNGHAAILGKKGRKALQQKKDFHNSCCPKEKKKRSWGVFLQKSIWFIIEKL